MNEATCLYCLPQVVPELSKLANLDLQVAFNKDSSNTGPRWDTGQHMWEAAVKPPLPGMRGGYVERIMVPLWHPCQLRPHICRRALGCFLGAVPFRV